MTYERAIDIVNECIERMKVIPEAHDYSLWKNIREALEKKSSETQKALEKQIPVGAPKRSWSNGAGYTDTFICPACEAHIHMPFMQKECDYNYCPYCGQRWED